MIVTVPVAAAGPVTATCCRCGCCVDQRREKLYADTEGLSYQYLCWFCATRSKDK